MKTKFSVLHFIVLVLALSFTGIAISNYVKISRIEKAHKDAVATVAAMEEEISVLKHELHRVDINSTKGFLINSVTVSNLMGDRFVEKEVYKVGIAEVMRGIPDEVREEAVENIVAAHDEATRNLDL